MKQCYLRSFTVLLVSFIACSSVQIQAQISVPASTLVTENFNSLAAGLTLPANWKVSTPGTGTASTYAGGLGVVTQAANSGTPTSGGAYNWGTTPGTDRAVGFMTDAVYPSDNSIMAFYQNTTVSTTLTVSFAIERYRVNTAAFSLSFSSSTNGTAWTAQPAGDISSGLFASGASSYTFQVGSPGSPQTIYKTFSITIPASANFYLRWVFTTPGNINSQGLGLDNVALYVGTATPVITAKLRDALTIDNPPVNRANPGDQLTYTDVIKNTGSGDATAVILTNPAPAQTTYNLGSLKTSALARDDNYSTPFNTALNVVAGGVLTNDFGMPAPAVLSFGPSANSAAMAAGGSGSSDNGGTLTVNADGTFNYTPAAGFTGSDKFAYLAGNGNLPNNDGIVTIAVLIAPAAVNDTYNDLVGNIHITDNVLTNDGGSNLLVTAVNGSAANVGNTITTANLSNITVNANGTFTYNPGPGWEGTESFTYTADNGLASPQTATVSLTVTGMIWFIDNTPGGGTPDGRFLTPFKTLGTFNAINTGVGTNNAAAGDNIFIYEGIGTYNGSIALLNNQKLIGQDATASLSTITGLTPPANSPPLPATNSGNVALVTLANTGDIITLATGGGNLIRGFTFAPTAGYAVITGASSSGTNTATDLIISATGNGAGVSLSNATGAFNYTTGSITCTGSGNSFFVNGGTPAITCSVPITHSGSGRLVSILNTTSTITFNTGTLSATSTTNQGILLSAVNGTVNFSNGFTLGSAGTRLGNPAVTISTGAGTYNLGAVNIFSNAATGLTSTNSTGTINCTSGTIDATSAAAIVISGPGGGTTLALALTTVNSTGGASNISLVNCIGTATLGNGALSGAGVASFNVSGGTVSTTYSGNITKTSALEIVSIAAHNTGTIAFNTGTLNATGGTGMQFSNADGTYNFNGTNTLNGGDAGIDITNGSGGTFTFSSNSAVTNPTGTVITIDASSPTFTYSGTFSKNNSGIGIAVTNNTGGAINLNGTGTKSLSSGTSNAIDITSNNAATNINFSGNNLSVTTTTGIGFRASASGPVTVTGTGNTITTTSGTGLDIQTTNAGAGGILFASVTSSSGQVANIVTSTGIKTLGQINTSSGTTAALNLSSAGTVNAGHAVAASLLTTSSGTGISISTTTLNMVGVGVDVNATTSGIGVSATAGVVDITGGNLNITTNTGNGFSAIFGGTVTVTGSNNTISTTSGTGLNINATNAGASGITFASIASVSGPVASIVTSTGTKTLGRINTSSGAATALTLTSAGTVNAGDASLSSTLTTSSGTGINIGTTTLVMSGVGVDVNATTSGIGVNVAGGVVDISGGNLNITTSAGAGFSAISSTVTVTGSNNTISSQTGTALNVSSSTVGAAGLAFATVSSNGAANGINLNTVTGTGNITIGGGTITGGAGAAINVVGSTGLFTYSGSASQATALQPLVSVSGGHSGTLTFNTGTLSATGGTGLQFDNADGTYNFFGTTTLNGGDAGVDIINGSAGGFTFGTGAAITSPAGIAFNVDGTLATVTSAITYSGNITQANNFAMVNVKNHNTGTITFQIGTLNATAGTGLQFDNADSPTSYNFNGTTTLNGGDAAIDIINGSSGTFNFSSGSSITNPSNAALNITGGTANVTYSGTFSKNNGTVGINISNNGGGTININGTSTKTISSGGNPAVSLVSNTGATINFSGNNLLLTTTSGTGFNATGGGTISVAGTGNTISSTTGTALNVVSTSISSTGLNFVSIASAGGSATGIILDNTGTAAANGGLTVNGDGSNTSLGGNGTGGTINGKTGTDGQTTNGCGIYLNLTKDVVLRRMNIIGTIQNHGIRGFQVTNFTMQYCTMNGTYGTSAAFDNYGEHAVGFGDDASATTNGLTGSSTITSCIFSGGRARNFSVVNTAGTLNRITITGCTFGLVQNFSDANAALTCESRNAGTTLNVTVQSCTFTGSPADASNFTSQTGTNMDVIYGGVTATPGTGLGNVISNSHAQNVSGGCNVTFASQGAMTFNCRGNTFRDANGSAITFFKASSGTSLTGTFDNNIIGVSGVVNSGSATGNGIYVSAAGTGTMTYTITNNQIHRINGNFHISADNTGGSYTANFVIQGNLFDLPGAGNAGAIGMTNGSPGSGDLINVCAVIGGSAAALKNTFNFSGGTAVYVGSDGAGAGHVFNLPGYAGGANFTNVQNFIQANNTGAFLANAFADPPATAAAFTGTGTTCPLLAARKHSSLIITTPKIKEESANVSFALTDQKLNTVVEEAIAIWKGLGLSDAKINLLRSSTYRVGKTSKGELGNHSLGVVTISPDADGNGWFMNCDAAKGLDTHADLLTCILHEMGHILGLKDLKGKIYSNSIMYSELPVGERRLPTKDVQRIGFN